MYTIHGALGSPYSMKMRARYAALDATARGCIDPLLAQTGCPDALVSQCA
jgi:hypothetical protein